MCREYLDQLRSRELCSSLDVHRNHQLQCSLSLLLLGLSHALNQFQHCASFIENLRYLNQLQSLVPRNFLDEHLLFSRLLFSHYRMKLMVLFELSYKGHFQNLLEQNSMLAHHLKASVLFENLDLVKHEQNPIHIRSMFFIQPF